MSTPTPDENQPMRDALQRDAARVPKPDFDPALHYATMRRLRALAETPTSHWRLSPALATAAALLLLSVLALWRPWQSPPENHLTSSPTSAPLPAVAPRASLLAYQSAANEGDTALFTMLDRDAVALLPASPSVFRTPLP